MFLGLLKNQSMDAGIEEFKATDGAVLIDVRTRGEFREGHVPGSINIDGADIHKASALIPDKQTPLFVHCLSGSRSARAASALKGLGFAAAKNIGGISSYTGPMVKGD